jgi:hypothetical protein
MKTHLLVLALFFLVFTSCTNEPNQELSQAQLMDLKMSEKTDHPAEIVPTDHPILLQFMRQEIDWIGMQDYFNEQLINYTDKPYYDNLLHMKTLLVQYPGVHDITSDQQKSYLDELVKLDRISNFATVANFIATSTKLTDGDKSYYASALLDINRLHHERSSPSYKEKKANDENYLAAVKVLEGLVKS